MGNKVEDCQKSRSRTAPAAALLLGVVVLTALPAGCGGEEAGFEEAGAAHQPLGPPVTASFQNGLLPSGTYSGNTDTTLAQATPTTNRGNQSTCYADGDNGSGNDLACLLRWTLSGIPAGSVIQVASITLRVTDATAHTYTAYAMRRAWNESQATWQRASTGVSWQLPGARGTNDRGAAVGTVTGATGFRTIVLNAQGIALVQSWLDAPATNAGVIVHSTSNSDGIDVASSETSTLANRPRLTITYAPPDASGGGGSGGGAGMGGTAGIGGSTGGTGGSTGGTAGGTPTAPNLLLAFIGDQGNNGNSDAVLELIRREGAAATMHNGDFDYEDNPAAWNARIDRILGENYPYFAVIGNHDAAAWNVTNGYASLIAARHARVPEMQCTGELGVKASCTFRGLHLVESCVGTSELRSSCAANSAEHVAFIRDTLANDGALWSICNWHKNQADMQIGTKTNEVGWLPYQECMRAGALVATGHEHSYARTRILTNVGDAAAGHGATGAFDLMQLGLGRNFVFVSGLAGVGIRPYDAASHDDDTWWASQYGSNRWLDNGVIKPVGSAAFGALFVRFHVDGDPKKALGYFKTVTDQVIDTFTIQTD